MDHQEAARNRLVELYLLNELSPAQQDEFEAHLFDCPQCAEALRAGAIFTDNARSVLRTEVQRPLGASPAVHGLPGEGWLTRMREWFRPPQWATAAAVLSLCLLGYQNLHQIPALKRELAEFKAPHAVATFALPPVTRGNEPVITPPPGARSVVVWFDLNTPSPGGYICEFSRDPGASWLTLRERPAADADSLYLHLDTALIPPGRNLLSVRSPDGRELMRYRFLYKP